MQHFHQVLAKSPFTSYRLMLALYWKHIVLLSSNKLFTTLLYLQCFITIQPMGKAYMIFLSLFCCSGVFPWMY